jgi:hypothetical protein
MFLVGMIAIGIGLGVEFKIVEIKGQLGKGGRTAAFGIGALLIATSVFIYTRPPQTTSATSNASAAPAATKTDAPATTEPAAAAPTAIPTDAPTATPVPPTATANPPTATPIPPTATAAPPTATTVPPTATAVPPTTVPPTAKPAPSATPAVVVPDIRGKTPKDAEGQLKRSGLQFGEKKEDCQEIGVSERDASKVKRGQILCQSPAPGSKVAPGTRINYVLAGKSDD